MVKRNDDHGNFIKKKILIRVDLQFQRFFYFHHDRYYDSRQAWYWRHFLEVHSQMHRLQEERESQWAWLGLKKPQSQPSVTYFQKTLLQQNHTSKFQSSNNEQVMKYMRLWGVFLFKPQESLYFIFLACIFLKIRLNGFK